MLRAACCGLLVSLLTLSAMEIEAHAQSAHRPIGGQHTRVGYSPNIAQPNVSPYLNLLNNPTGQVTNYQSLVRPLFDQQTINNRQGAAINRLQNQVSATRPGSSTQGSTSIRPTGHIATFQNYSHFYPGLR